MHNEVWGCAEIFPNGLLQPQVAKALVMTENQ